ncbi:MAG: nuclear transport factor 2 family protein [Sphingopyxis sp.]|uniref:nuclear transport factor 2 family protein n=1 Tax=Sphingopyxis sp. TaxID=1908224 RepID=UPI001A4A94F3|nr:nuclear transport factor 2 family protein [Sphingopyxis sp.]MBL9071387.1 nuclear transport factor 2 family protein [Sphingopyxis sp.]
MRSPDEEAALAVVDRMKEGWQKLDGDLILSLFHDDAVMQSMMKEPYRGKAEIKAMLDGFFAIATAVRMEVLNRRVEGNVVTLERRDHFTARGKSGILPAVGIFEVEDGLIRTWREYYDWGMYERQIAD